mgnify:CR=1 FL=1
MEDLALLSAQALRYGHMHGVWAFPLDVERNMLEAQAGVVLSWALPVTPKSLEDKKGHWHFTVLSGSFFNLGGIGTIIISHCPLDSQIRTAQKTS